MPGRTRRESATLKGPLRARILTRSPRGRRRRPSRVLPALLVLLAASGIASYWYAVFFVVEPAEATSDPANRTGRGAGGSLAGGPGPDGGVSAAPPRGFVADDWIRDSIVRTSEGLLERGMTLSDRYVVLAFPGGDVPPDRGTSADLLVRVLRALGLDLQFLLHRDRVAAPEAYPLYRWKSKRPDTSIDHRRMANVAVFLQRYADSRVTRTSEAALRDYAPGDIVTWGVGRSEFPTNLGVVRDVHTEDGVPFVVTFAPKEDNLSGDHLVTDWLVKGHYRIDMATVERILERLAHDLPPEAESPVPAADAADAGSAGTAAPGSDDRSASPGAVP